MPSALKVQTQRILGIIAGQMRITAGLIMKVLSAELYRDSGQMVMELIRNSVVAASSRGWEPLKAHVEVTLERGHPLNPTGNVFSVFDRGSGITDIGWHLYMNIGQDLATMATESLGTHNGASQKRIGRLVGFSLNAASRGGDATQGFVVISRMADSDIIKLVMTPELIEKSQLKGEPIADNDPLLGQYRGKLPPTFTLVLVPNPVFAAAEDIEEVVRWLLPRESDKMFPLWINGKKIQAPPLAGRILAIGRSRVNPNVLVEGFAIDKLEPGKKTGHDGGIWLTDKDTSLRVAKVAELGSYAPDPLGHPMLFGDIIVKDLLSVQNTARGGLKNDFLKSKLWKKIANELYTDVSPRARELFEPDELYQSSDNDSCMLEVNNMFHVVEGEPTGSRSSGGPRNGTGSGTGGGGGGSGGSGGSGGGSGPGGGVRPLKGKATLSIKCDGEEYQLVLGSTMPPHRYAMLAERRGKTIVLNPNALLPTERKRKVEYMLNATLIEIGRSRYDDDVERVVDFAANKRTTYPGGPLFQKPKS